MRRTAKPLSPATFLRRNVAKTAPLIAVIVLAVMLIASIVAIINSIPLSIRTIYKTTSEFLILAPRGDPTVTPKILSKLKEAPVPLERIIRYRNTGTIVKSVVGKWPFSCVGLAQGDMEYFLKRLHVTSLSGRMPKPGEPGAIISDPVAKNLRLGIGSILLKPDDTDNYSPHEVKVVGIAHTQDWLMVTDIEYLRANQFLATDLVLAFTKDRSQQAKLGAWSKKAFKGMRVLTFTYEQIEHDTQEMFRILYLILDVVIGILVLVITVMMGMLINIYQSQRVVEFGLLQALGYTRMQLVRRSLLESVIVLVMGWALGIVAAAAILRVTKHYLMDPYAFALDIYDPAAYRYTIPVPLAILVVAIFTVFWRFRKFDPVSVVERRLV